MFSDMSHAIGNAAEQADRIRTKERWGFLMFVFIMSFSLVYYRFVGRYQYVGPVENVKM
jgi:hypothetical protein